MRKAFVVAAAVALVGLTGCSSSGTPSAAQTDAANTNTQLDRYQKNQPAPAADWSQYRQTVIDVEQAEIHGMATTTFFFNLGIKDPIRVCPSIGYPVPATSQLTSPDQLVGNGGSSNYYAAGVVGQAEPNGTFTGVSAGTNVVCVLPSGKKDIEYGEPNAYAVGGPAHWDKALGQVVPDGDPTVTVTSKK